MIHAVIMAGGTGTRFWPHSRNNCPKQLLRIAGHKSMIRATVDRMAPLVPNDRMMVVCGESHADAITRELPELHRGRILREPVGRNTAPCIAVAAHKLVKEDPEAIMLVLPADHVIGNEAGFREAVQLAVELAARNEDLFVFGVAPHRAETGYGYIKIDGPLPGHEPMTALNVAEFAEKPSPERAASYLASGEYLWNSGMFVWSAHAIISALETHAPQVNEPIRRIAPALGTAEESNAIRTAYERIDAISIDHAVMEHANNVLCIPIDVGWNDVGSWASIEDLWELDEDGNAIQGEVVTIDTKHCIVSSSHKLVTLIGAEDLIVVDTPDALMICRKDRGQDVKQLQDILLARGYGHLL